MKCEELVVNLTVKPPQDIMLPPSCRVNPPHRCWMESAPLEQQQKEDKENAALLFPVLTNKPQSF